MVTAHRITYEGPAGLAMGAATVLADAEGVELTSADRPEPLAGLADRVRLAVNVEGAPEDVAAAAALVRAGLPTDAELTVADADTR